MDMDKKATGFDLVVTHRDPKSGVVTRQNPYVLTVVGGENGKSRLFERPPRSGNLFDKRGNPCGRWKTDEAGKKVWDKDATHVEFVAPETKDQRLARENIEGQAKIAQLEAELAAIRAEGKPKAEGKAKASVSDEKKA